MYMIRAMSSLGIPLEKPAPDAAMAAEMARGLIEQGYTAVSVTTPDGSVFKAHELGKLR